MSIRKERLEVKMKYYESHEECYKKVKKSNTSSWDEFHKSADAFENFCMKEFLTVALDRINPESNSRILDIGCGTGPAACFLAQQGYLVHGIDVSRTAIEMAQTNARERGLSIHFSVDDICRFSETGSGIYDIVSDTHCMHCITHDADRKAALSSIFRLLKKGGHFVMETMSIQDTSRWSDNGRMRMDDEGILWNEVKIDYPYDKVSFEDKFWMCTRRVLSPSALQKELEQTGFLIEYRGTTQDDDIEYMADFQVICRKPSA